MIRKKSICNRRQEVPPVLEPSPGIRQAAHGHGAGVCRLSGAGSIITANITHFWP